MKQIIIGEKFDCKYDFREVCFGIIAEKNKILIVEKDNQFSLVGGGIEANETYEECIKREFLEESGYTVIGMKELICIDCYWLAANKYPQETKANIFIVEIDKNNFQQPLQSEHKIHWVDVSKVKDLIGLPYQQKAVEYYLLQGTTC